jgi:hypothetical protein
MSSKSAGAARAERQLRDLNLGFAGWVAAQIQQNPGADWSAAATEYAGFVQKIKDDAGKSGPAPATKKAAHRK